MSVANEILSVAVFVPLPGQEGTALATVRELSRTLTRSGYSRDTLYRGPEGEYVLVRYWKSDDARRAALDDAEAQRCWAKVAHEIRILKVYESLDKVPL
ncbi:MAG TPA: antibiotic biosynthesis monooxygenase [Terriglobales bacterium]|nr:antibiotic biosynthesis monooxygenase [Terriglobales bacterium]